MGCGQSKLEPDDEAAAAGKRPPSSGRKVFGDIRRRRNADRESRKGRFIRPEQESDAGDETHLMENGAGASDKPALSPMRSPLPEDKEERSRKTKKKKVEKKKKKMEKVAAAEEEKKADKEAAAMGEEEEQPGSPSFRFYFDGSVPRWMDNESRSADATKNDKEDQGKHNIYDQKAPGKISEDNASQNVELQEYSGRELPENDEEKRFKGLGNGCSESYNISKVNIVDEFNSNH